MSAQIPIRPHIPFDDTDARVIEPECLPMQVVAPLAKLLLRRTYASSWPDGQHVAGRDMVVRSIVSIYASCTSSTAQAVDRVYRLLDSRLIGRVWSTDYMGDGTMVLEPVPQVPEGNGSVFPLLSTAMDTMEATLSGLLGISGPHYPAATGVKNDTAAILTLMQSQSGDASNADLLAQLLNIAGLLA